jgi:hypothetical protein
MIIQLIEPYIESNLINLLFKIGRKDKSKDIEMLMNNDPGYIFLYFNLIDGK